jgi:hypothetical protein
MPDKSDEEICKSIKRFEKSLPETDRNPDAQEDTQRLIERTAQPLPEDDNSVKGQSLKRLYCKI